MRLLWHPKNYGKVFLKGRLVFLKHDYKFTFSMSLILDQDWLICVVDFNHFRFPWTLFRHRLERTCVLIAIVSSRCLRFDRRSWIDFSFGF